MNENIFVDLLLWMSQTDHTHTYHFRLISDIPEKKHEFKISSDECLGPQQISRVKEEDDKEEKRGDFESLEVKSDRNRTTEANQRSNPFHSI